MTIAGNERILVISPFRTGGGGETGDIFYLNIKDLATYLAKKIDFSTTEFENSISGTLIDFNSVDDKSISADKILFDKDTANELVALLSDNFIDPVKVNWDNLTPVLSQTIVNGISSGGIPTTKIDLSLLSQYEANSIIQSVTDSNTILTLYETNNDVNRFTDVLSSHYKEPVSTVTELQSLSYTSLNNLERRYVKSENVDFVWHSDASFGEYEPVNKPLSSSQGYWISSSKRINPDFSETDPNSDTYISNVPPLSPVATTGQYDDLLNPPSVDWEETDPLSKNYISNKPLLNQVFRDKYAALASFPGGAVNPKALLSQDSTLFFDGDSVLVEGVFNRGDIKNSRILTYIENATDTTDYVENPHLYYWPDDLKDTASKARWKINVEITAKIILSTGQSWCVGSTKSVGGPIIQSNRVFAWNADNTGTQNTGDSFVLAELGNNPFQTGSGATPLEPNKLKNPHILNNEGYNFAQRVSIEEDCFVLLVLIGKGSTSSEQWNPSTPDPTGELSQYHRILAAFEGPNNIFTSDLYKFFNNPKLDAVTISQSQADNRVSKYVWKSNWDSFIAALRGKDWAGPEIKFIFAKPLYPEVQLKHPYPDLNFASFDPSTSPCGTPPYDNSTFKVTSGASPYNYNGTDVCVSNLNNFNGLSQQYNSFDMYINTDPYISVADDSGLYESAAPADFGGIDIIEGDIIHLCGQSAYVNGYYKFYEAYKRIPSVVIPEKTNRLNVVSSYELYDCTNITSIQKQRDYEKYGNWETTLSGPFASATASDNGTYRRLYINAVKIPSLKDLGYGPRDQLGVEYIGEQLFYIESVLSGQNRVILYPVSEDDPAFINGSGTPSRIWYSGNSSLTNDDLGADEVFQLCNFELSASDGVFPTNPSSDRSILVDDPTRGLIWTDVDNILGIGPDLSGPNITLNNIITSATSPNAGGFLFNPKTILETAPPSGFGLVQGDYIRLYITSDTADYPVDANGTVYSGEQLFYVHLLPISTGNQNAVLFPVNNTLETVTSFQLTGTTAVSAGTGVVLYKPKTDSILPDNTTGEDAYFVSTDVGALEYRPITHLVPENTSGEISFLQSDSSDNRSWVNLDNFPISPPSGTPTGDVDTVISTNMLVGNSNFGTFKVSSTFISTTLGLSVGDWFKLYVYSSTNDYPIDVVGKRAKGLLDFYVGSIGATDSIIYPVTTQGSLTKYLSDTGGSITVANGSNMAVYAVYGGYTRPTNSLGVDGLLLQSPTNIQSIVDASEYLNPEIITGSVTIANNASPETVTLANANTYTILAPNVIVTKTSSNFTLNYEGDSTNIDVDYIAIKV